ncbi:pyridoxal 5'-phosphate synthase glutaminase subunit PdxT [Leucobacter sp. NPDC058333]|uniref:pyridoxal 5'-phosphate synthase glutaminase subunit PdxT n=1 Tax=Leucobacter sp. NPDC058333 TaxID=3346450 RepID=UPI003647D707
MSPSDRRLTVGVLALQGGVAEHVEMLERLGARITIVRRERDLAGADGLRVDALVLPGGESSTQDRLLRLFDMAAGLRGVIEQGVPTLGTCAGLVLLAREVHDPAPGQGSLAVLDVAVRRNALGSQVESREAEIAVDAGDVVGQREGRVRAALIRAPEVVSVGDGARAICRIDGRVFGATSAVESEASTSEPDAVLAGSDRPKNDRPMRLGSVTGIAFHPELTVDPAFHRALLAQAARPTGRPADAERGKF